MSNNNSSNNKYNDKLIDFLFQYGFLTNELKKIYPIYKKNPKDPEVSSSYNKIKKQINDIYLSLDGLDVDVENDNIKKDNMLNKINDEIKSNKKYYKTHKPKLNDIIGKIQGDKPREKEYEYKLHNKYIDFGYLLVSFGLLIYFYRKMLY